MWIACRATSPLHRSPEWVAAPRARGHGFGVAATLFVDENLRRGFGLLGVVVTTGEIGRARATMRAQLPRGARRVHFVKDE